MTKIAKAHDDVMHQLMKSCLGKNQLATASDAKMAATPVQQHHDAALGLAGKCNCGPNQTPPKLYAKT